MGKQQPNDAARLSKLHALCSRFTEIADPQLLEIEDLLAAELAGAADAKDVERARGISQLIEKTRGEVRRRRQAAEEAERELAGMLRAAGLADDEPEPEEEPEPEAAAVLASLTDKPLPRIGDLASRRKQTQSLRASRQSGPAFTSSRGGYELSGLGDVADEMVSILRVGPVEGRLTVATFEQSVPEERRLGSDWTVNQQRIEAVTSPRALLALGGICGPLEGFYSMPGKRRSSSGDGNTTCRRTRRPSKAKR